MAVLLKVYRWRQVYSPEKLAVAKCNSVGAVDSNDVLIVVGDFYDSTKLAPSTRVTTSLILDSTQIASMKRFQVGGIFWLADPFVYVNVVEGCLLLFSIFVSKMV